MSVVERIRKLAKLAQEISNEQLQQELMALQTDVIELQEENRQLRDQIDESDDKLALRDHFRFEQNFYWLYEDDVKVGPYCPNCFDTEHVAQRMTGFEHNHLFACPSCGEVLRSNGSPASEQEKMRCVTSLQGMET